MILILSSNSDITTNEVIDWLIHFNQPFIRINETDIVRIEAINLNIMFYLESINYNPYFNSF